MKRAFLLAAGLAAGFGSMVSAAEAPTPQTITVVGSGSVETPPDVGVIGYDVRGEGDTAEAATRAFVEKRQAVEAALDGMTAIHVTLQTSNLRVDLVRAHTCDDNYETANVLSTGDCAVVGYIADMRFTGKVSPATATATALGQAARAGAISTSMNGFQLTNDSTARTRAAEAALADAKVRATAIAAGSGLHLGTMTNVQDAEARAVEPNYEGSGGMTTVTVTATGSSASSRAVPAPIDLTVKPEPITTSTALIVTYRLAP